MGSQLAMKRQKKDVWKHNGKKKERLKVHTSEQKESKRIVWKEDK